MTGLPRLIALFAALLVAVAANASGRVATLSASGQLEIGPDGRVLSHRIDERVQAPVATAIARTLDSWNFEPVLEDGRPVIAVTRMHLTIEAIERSADEVALRVKDVWFGDSLKLAETRPPRYPIDALRAGLAAQVIMALRLDEAGRVVDAHPYQTSFAPGVSSQQARRFRSRFENVSLEAVRHWRYSAELGKPGGATVLAPITFTIQRTEQNHRPGHWSVWEPGEIVPPPWKTGQTASLSAHSLTEGTAMLADERIRLLTDAGGSVL